MYYRTLNGIKYDHNLLVMAEKFQDEESALSDNEVWQIMKSCTDTGNFTKTELITLSYIQGNFILSPQMQEQMRMILFMCYSLIP
jgi:hypothetical protein|tara:strand:- start:4785 stop:5039 length:255 start_codon:yes stop_codon:yes gene_type:complete